MKLPPDPEGLNDDRAMWAGDAIDLFADTTGLTVHDGLDTMLSDLLANVRHWCGRNDVDFQACLQRAESHYEAETSE